MPRTGRPALSRREAQPSARAGDREQRRQAARLAEVFPHWLVLWGAWTREFWAYPRFDVPRGTIAHAADAADLAGMMRAVQRSAEDGWR